MKLPFTSSIAIVIAAAAAVATTSNAGKAYAFQMSFLDILRQHDDWRHYSTSFKSLESWNDGNTMMSQSDFMERDAVLVVSDKDEVLGSTSKKESHLFTPTNQRGILHRAFSVFLYDASTQELLLQQRASTKITFPNVWTNTCCSHPLHGMEVNEVDSSEDVKDGSVKGVKAAAIRKLEHELGIPAGELPMDSFKFLTRLQYWAADTVTHGKKR